MTFFELEASDISSLDDGDLRELVARLCEAELIQQNIQPSCVIWGGAQEAADGGVDVSVRDAVGICNPNFVPRKNTVFQVKKHSMGMSACRKEMEKDGKPKVVIADLASQGGAYIIVSGKDDCSDKMLTDRLNGMEAAINILPDKNNLYLDFYGRDRLSAWLRQHPSVALWVRSRLGKPLAGWRSYGRWAATPVDQDDQFFLDDHPCVTDANSKMKEKKSVSEGIQLTRDRLRDPGSTVRIIGLSGVGKTRFAQALFETKVGTDALPESDVIYADLGHDIAPTASQLVTYLVTNGFATYLVLDNCPPDIHRLLQREIAENNAKLRLLTIEYDISDDKPEETEVVELEPASEETVSKLIERRFPSLDRINADRIAQFAGGNARIALALASRVNADETLSNFSDEDLFQRLFSQRKGESQELKLAAESLALVYSFNVCRTERGDELGVLSAISGLTRDALYRGQAELLRRQLAQQRGSWRAILPHALANRLAKRALQNIPLGDINAQLLRDENLRLFQSCAHRLGYLHDFDEARDLASSWIQPGKPLGNIAACDERYLVVLDYVAPVFPEVVLRALEQASMDPGFASRRNRNFSRFSRLLCHLAYEDESFDRAVDVLLKFAETEQAGERNDSIVAQMRQLFSLHLSGTEAKPERRQAFVRRLVKSGDYRHREIAIELLDSAFEANRWTSSGTFHFGARKRGPGWSPRTRDEEIGWYSGYIKLLEPLLSSTQTTDQDWAKSVLARHFRGLWVFARCFDTLEEIIQNHGRDGAWPEIWVSIGKTIDLDGDRHTSKLLARLKSLGALTAPSDLYSEIGAYVLVDVWHHTELHGQSFQKRENEIRDKVIRLGKRAASDLEILIYLGPRIWKESVGPLAWFGRGLAMGSKDRIGTFGFLVKLFQEQQLSQTYPLLLDGFIRGVYGMDPSQAHQLIEKALGIPELKPYAINLLAAVPAAPWILKEVIEFAQGGELEAWRFEQFCYGRKDERIADCDLALILTALNRLDRGYLSTIKILSVRLFGDVRGEYIPSDEICAVARDAIRRLVVAPRDEQRRPDLYGIDRVLEEAFSGSAPEDEVKEIIRLLCDGINSYRLYSFELTEIISALIKRYPEHLLDVVFDGSENELNLSALLFRENTVRERPSVNDIPLHQIATWCGNDQARIEKIAKAVHAYETSSASDAYDDNIAQVVLGEHIKALLEMAIDKLSVVEIIFNDIRPSIWSGSLADIIEARSKAFAELFEYPDSNVQKFVRSKLSVLREWTCKEREREAAIYNEREQRFE